MGKTAVVGASQEVTAKVVEATDASTLQGFIAQAGPKIYTDDARARGTAES